MLQICPPQLSVVASSHFILGNPKKSFSAVLFIHTSDHICYLRRKQTVIHLPTPRENITTLTCELQNYSISLKVCCILSNVGGCEESPFWVVGGSERTGCDVWQLECQASSVTASVQRDHLLH